VAVYLRFWSGRVDSNHRPPGPEPDTRVSRKLLKMLRFQLAEDKAVVLSLVEAYCALLLLDALSTTRSSTFATNDLGDHRGLLSGSPTIPLCDSKRTRIEGRSRAMISTRGPGRRPFRERLVLCQVTSGLSTIHPEHISIPCAVREDLRDHAWSYPIRGRLR
jgi:hypothetical protein